MQTRLHRFWRVPSDHWRFFRQWLRHPVKTAAISPSGPFLVRSMMSELPRDARRVIELGAGTGVMTRALIARGIAPSDLLVVELNPDLAVHLAKEFPGTPILCADARDLESESEKVGYAQGGPADAVVSSLGLLSMPRELQHDILAAAFDCLKPDGRFIQFTYGPRSPIKPEVLQALGLHVVRGETVLRNVPPATVFVYTKSRSKPVSVRRMSGTIS
jgi:phosphatidylethanolamine/phosphatidyl-N-methylethanolamine N-methyltransferase